MVERVFGFAADTHVERWKSDGYVHVPGGADPRFLEHLRQVVAAEVEEQRLQGRGLAGAKDQFLFEFPKGLDYERELFDTVAALCGLRRESLTLSERHIKMYRPDAAPDPEPHKDRLASTVAMGISITNPENSRVLLYPRDQRDENPFLGPVLRDSLEPEEFPETSLRGRPAVELDTAPGDVLLFPGSSTWHLRRRSANAVLLYFKFNDFDSDPMGEDPRTALRRRETMGILESGDVASAIVRLSRRFDALHERHSRRGWSRSWLVDVWGQPPFWVSDGEAVLLRLANGRDSAAELAAQRPGGLGGAETLRAVARLARRNAVELFRHGSEFLVARDEPRNGSAWTENAVRLPDPYAAERSPLPAM